MGDLTDYCLGSSISICVYTIFRFGFYFCDLEMIILSKDCMQNTIPFLEIMKTQNNNVLNDNLYMHATLSQIID